MLTPLVRCAVLCAVLCCVFLQVGGYWSSGLPYLDASYKATKRPWEAGLQLPLVMLNISDLQVRLFRFFFPISNLE